MTRVGVVSPGKVVVPYLVLAACFDGWVDQLIPLTAEQPSARARECNLDLVVGLVDAAAALRSAARLDTAEALCRLRSAVEHLRDADPAELLFPLGGLGIVNDRGWSRPIREDSMSFAHAILGEHHAYRSS